MLQSPIYLHLHLHLHLHLLLLEQTKINQIWSIRTRIEKFGAFAFAFTFLVFSYTWHFSSLTQLLLLLSTRMRSGDTRH